MSMTGLLSIFGVGAILLGFWIAVIRYGNYREAAGLQKGIDVTNKGTEDALNELAKKQYAAVDDPNAGLNVRVRKPRIQKKSTSPKA